MPSRVDDAVHTIQSVLSAVGADAQLEGQAAVDIGSAPPVTSRVELRKDIAAAAGAIHHRSTSVSLLWGDDSNEPTAEQVSSIMQEYEQVVLHFCALSHGAMAGAGTTLKKAIKGCVNEVVTACADLLLATGDISKRKQLKTLTGLVWQACEAAKKMPADNRTAMTRRLTRAAKAVKDAEKEGQEMLEDAASAKEGGGGGDDDEDDEGDGGFPGDSDDDLDFDVDALSAEEQATAQAAIEVTSGLVDSFKAVLKGWLSAEFPSAEEDIGALEKALENALKAGEAAENLVAALYAPQDPEEVGAASSAVRDRWEAAQVGLESVGQLTDAVQDASSSLAKKLERLEATITDLAAADALR